MSKTATKSAGKARTAYVCTECGADHTKWQGQCARMRRVELAERDRAWSPRPRARAWPHRAAAGWAGKVDAPAVTPLKDVSHAEEVARQHRHRRVRPRARRRPGAKARWCWWAATRASASRRCCCRRWRRWPAALPGAVRHRRGIAGAGRRPRARAWACRWTACTRWPKPASSASWSTPREAKPRLIVADSMQTLWTGAADRRARLGQPGARKRRAAGALRQGNRHRGVPGRPRHQGRRHRRPARARAHGRRGAVFRRRERQPLPRAARVQEPLRRGQRTGRVRDGRQGPEGSAQPVGDLPVRRQHAASRAAA